MTKLAFLGLASLAIAACGGSAQAPSGPSEATMPAPRGAPPPAPAPTHKASTPEKPAAGLPTACADEGKAAALCTPPAAFVKRLCGGFYPDIALILFAKGSPWTRGYLAKNVQAWNASGGASSSDKLEFDEEVIVLHHREAAAGAMQVSGTGGGYEVLRWDGTCASLAREEVTLKGPPKAKNAKIPWKRLDTKVREALLADEKVESVDSERRKECKGMTMGGMSATCVKADTRLSDVVAEYVRRGGTVPEPANLP